MTGQEALEYGIVDKVITKREMVSRGKNNKKKNIHVVD
jgi:ATP-dependent protease ClpP protease subunit